MFYLQENKSERYDIYFGNDVIGKSIADGSIVSITYLITNFTVPGQMQYQILDITSKLLFRSQPVNGINNKQTKIELSNYPAGTYYVLVFFKPITGISKTGIYKIVKL